MHHNPWLPRAHEVDYEHRSKVAPNHTMTHVLNWALREAGVGTRWNWRKMQGFWGSLKKYGTAIRDQFKHKIRKYNNCIEKGATHQYRARFWGMGSINAVLWSQLTGRWDGWDRLGRSQENVAIQAWYSMQRVSLMVVGRSPFSAEPSANLATMDFPWKSRCFFGGFLNVISFFVANVAQVALRLQLWSEQRCFSGWPWEGWNFGVWAELGPAGFVSQSQVLNLFP